MLKANNKISCRTMQTFQTGCEDHPDTSGEIRGPRSGAQVLAGVPAAGGKMCWIERHEEHPITGTAFNCVSSGFLISFCRWP